MKKQIYLLFFVVFLSGVSNATMLVHYTFDEATGATTVADTAGSYNGTLGSYQSGTNTGLYATGLAGKYGNAAGFYSSNGSSAGGWTLADATPLLSSSFTVSFWINTERWLNSAWFTYVNQASGLKMIVYSETTGTGATGLSAKIGDYSSTDSITVVNRLALGTTGTSNEWLHVAAVVTNLSDLTLYVDGVSYASSTSTAGYGFGTAGMDGLKLGGRFGANGTNNKYVNGLMDDFAIIDSALNAEQILAIYNSSIPIPEPITFILLSAGLGIVRIGRKK
ncbi:MAG: hypothetical protein A2Y10_19880 [Planctomycetes bacterium GWF2_41_51]|nr:MAG: hypothetical protein A2Y10_19880 [Planctomycetes bacterium GWF2_41_51]HBG28545.1 hypothetical protein [Phycisphaerales bacterium]